MVVSLTLRNRWEDGRIERGSGRYSQWAFDVAKYAAVPFIDLMNQQADAFDALGEDKVKAFLDAARLRDWQQLHRRRPDVVERRPETA